MPTSGGNVFDSFTTYSHKDKVPTLALWNYDPSSRYGPKRWDDIDTDDSEHLDLFEDKGNDCDHDKQQSPITVYSRDICQHDHQLFPRRGDNDFDTLRFEVLGESLRMNVKERKGTKQDNPRADFSNSTPTTIPVVYAEVKMPSEHYLFGKQYVGEFHIAHYWDQGRGRYVMVSIMMDDGDNKHHRQLEEFIREWEDALWEIKHECVRRIKKDLPPYKRQYSRRSSSEMKKIWGRSKKKGEKGDWDMYAFLTTVWYCGYRGSLTVPPCSERVDWRILDLPMQISRNQSYRMKKLLLDQVDPKTCRRSTRAYRGGVNRPLQDDNNNDRAWCCDSGDWKPDDPKEWRGKFPRGYHGYKYSK